MSLEQCSHCGQQISTSADRCPHCGASEFSRGWEKVKDKQSVLIGLGVVSIILGIMIYATLGDEYCADADEFTEWGQEKCGGGATGAYENPDNPEECCRSDGSGALCFKISVFIAAIMFIGSGLQNKN